MNPSSPQHPPAEPFDDYDYDDGFDDELPARPRARYLTPVTALLMALILGGVGFYVGIRVEKSKASTSGGSTLARAFSGAGGFGGGASSSSTSRTGGSGTSSLASRVAGGAPGSFGGAGDATIGSISSIKGNTLYVSTTSGNTVKVKLSSATTISKSESVPRKKLFPGDEVVIAGAQGSKGTVTATSVTDSGSRTTGTSSSSSSSSTGSSGNASSAIKSLFGGG